MRTRSLVYQPELVLQGARAEQEDHAGCLVVSVVSFSNAIDIGNSNLHQGVRKADFGSIHGAIAHTLEQGEVFCILRVQDDLVHGILKAACLSLWNAWWIWAITLTVSMAVAGSIKGLWVYGRAAGALEVRSRTTTTVECISRLRIETSNRSVG